MTIPQRSLFDAPPDPAIGDAGRWTEQLITGQVVVTLCVIAVLFLGFAMLTGRLPIRRGGEIVMGCFLLLGSFAIAAGFHAFAHYAAGSNAPVFVRAEPAPEVTPTPPANYDPYAGASLRRSGD